MRRLLPGTCLLALLAFAGSPRAATLPDSLARWLDALGGDSLQVQLVVRDLAGGGATLYSRLGELRQAPASLMKLCTASLALELWGPGHRFATRLGYRPADMLRVDGRRLARGLYLRPSGDPTLVPDDLVRLHQQLWREGVDGLAGPLFIQANQFDARRLGPGWTWDDGGASYAARPSQLSIQGNSLFALPGPHDWELPGSALLRVSQQPAARGAQAQLQRAWEDAADDFVFMAPLLPRGGPHPGQGWSTHPPEPACNVEYPDSLFRSCCLEAEEEVFGSAPLPVLNREVDPAAAGVVWREHLSPPLAVILSMLTESWNLGAENIFQGLAAWTSPAGRATWEGATELSRRVLRDSLGVDGWFRQVDGSGLSRYNAIAPRQLVQLLSSMEARHPGQLARLLPAAGEGTLRGAAPALPPGVELAAKTGTLRGVMGLAGYLSRPDRPRLAFCLLISGHQTGRTALQLRNEAVGRLAAWLAASNA